MSGALEDSPEDISGPDGVLAQGLFRGSVRSVDWRRLRDPRVSALERSLRHKRWLYAAVTTPDLYFGAAIVDVGYVANAFVFVADLAAGKTLVQRSALGVPGIMARVGPCPIEGASARFRSPGFELLIDRASGAGAWSVRGRVGRHVEVDVRLAGDGVVPITYIGAVGDGGARPRSPRGRWHDIARRVGPSFYSPAMNCTMKVACADVEGRLSIDGRDTDLARAMGGLDFTSGLLPRKTRWRWAFAMGRDDDGESVAFNLVEGFNAPAARAQSEDAVWHAGEPHALGRARFTHDREKYLEPWRIATEDGAADLVFTPAAGYHERHNLGFARSRFLQVAGRYSGTVRVGDRVVKVSDLPGVAEDQDVVW